MFESCIVGSHIDELKFGPQLVSSAVLVNDAYYKYVVKIVNEKDHDLRCIEQI
jgi:hypothetical protein